MTMMTTVGSAVVPTLLALGSLFATPREVPAVAEFIVPVSGALIEDRLDFLVAGSISDPTFRQRNGAHYWVSVAQVRANGRPGLHWPKFYVREPEFSRHTSDGGTNPFRDPQEMQLLLLRVDDATDQIFVRWLRNGPEQGYPGFHVDETQIAARVQIFFK